MKLTSQMQNLSEEIITSFKQRIQNNDELVVEVQKTLDGFRKGHQEMVAVLNANAKALKEGIASGEKERLNTYDELLTGIHQTIASIKSEVISIQTATSNMLNEFTSDRAQMAVGLNEFFVQNGADRAQNEKNRTVEFDVLMKNINGDIKSINDEVLSIFKNTNVMLEKFQNEQQEMSVELRAEISKNLAERVEYTRTLINGFQTRLAEISKENQLMAQTLQNDLAKSEEERLTDYNSIMKEILAEINTIRNEVKEIQKNSTELVSDFAQDRNGAATSWNNMISTISQLRKKDAVPLEK